MKTFNRLSILLGTLIIVCASYLIENLLIVMCLPNSGLFTLGIMYYQCHDPPGIFFSVVLLLKAFTCYIGGTLPHIIGDGYLRHTVMIGIVVSSFAIAFAFISFYPVWYNIVSVLIIIPCCFAGWFVTQKVSFVFINITLRKK